MTVSYDAQADVLYVRVQERRRARTEPLDTYRLVDYGEDDSIVGIEFLEASRGLCLDGMPRPELIRELAASEPMLRARLAAA